MYQRQHERAVAVASLDWSRYGATTTVKAAHAVKVGDIIAVMAQCWWYSYRLTKFNSSISSDTKTAQLEHVQHPCVMRVAEVHTRYGGRSGQPKKRAVRGTIMKQGIPRDHPLGYPTNHCT